MKQEKQSETVLHFWFTELTPNDWFIKSEALDEKITARFASLHKQATQNELAPWRVSARGALAEIIVLDQFSRNIYRDTPDAFASDAQSLALAQMAIHKGFDHILPSSERRFLYMPYMHSESRVIHEQALELFKRLGDATSLLYEEKHKVIIDRFGRYPHRNAILGRDSTPDEIEFLRQPNSSF